MKELRSRKPNLLQGRELEIAPNKRTNSDELEPAVTDVMRVKLLWAEHQGQPQKAGNRSKLSEIKLLQQYQNLSKLDLQQNIEHKQERILMERVCIYIVGEVLFLGKGESPMWQCHA